ncbi:MAG TPA: NADAR family protein [Ktedonobacteraceae bacterium]|nr:NADAR family protein [Ktedonobacteraceae bacterium]
MELQAYRTYRRNECAVFLKTAEQYGGLSNMAGGYPLLINGVRILTSEALYQACRFPHLPEVQKLIIGQKSPMAAKMKSKPYRKDSRPDWDSIRVHVMRWCLRVKLVQHWENFGELLLSTGDNCHPLIILAAGLRPVRTGGEASGDTPHPGRGEPPAPRVMSGCQEINLSLRNRTEINFGGTNLRMTEPCAEQMCLADYW